MSIPLEGWFLADQGVGDSLNMSLDTLRVQHPRKREGRQIWQVGKRNYMLTSLEGSLWPFEGLVRAEDKSQHYFRVQHRRKREH